MKYFNRWYLNQTLSIHTYIRVKHSTLFIDVVAIKVPSCQKMGFQFPIQFIDQCFLLFTFPQNFVKMNWQAKLLFIVNRPNIICIFSLTTLLGSVNLLVNYLKVKIFYKFNLWVNSSCKVGKKCSTVRSGVMQGILRRKHQAQILGGPRT